MNTSFAEQNIQEIEENGFITNCGPNHTLFANPDDVGKYCEYLNKLACHTNLDEQYKSLHLNEPAGNFAAIFKPEFDREAKKELDRYATKAAKEFCLSRSW